MSLKTPKQCEADEKKTTSKGNEWWASKFVYPNGWHFSSFKKVALREEEPGFNTYSSYDYGAFRTLATLGLAIALINTAIDWQLL